jgi:hypothetical protein
VVARALPAFPSSFSPSSTGAQLIGKVVAALRPNASGLYPTSSLTDISSPRFYYSVYLLYQYQSTNTDLQNAAASTFIYLHLQDTVCGFTAWRLSLAPGIDTLY